MPSQSIWKAAVLSLSALKLVFIRHLPSAKSSLESGLKRGVEYHLTNIMACYDLLFEASLQQ